MRRLRRHDPLFLTMPTKLLPRDAEVLAAIGRFRMLTRPQVKRWFFREVSEPVVTRFIQRVRKSGYVGIERLGGNGMQVLWLTRKGRDALVARGVPAADLFPATGPAAAKDFDHTVAIGDVAAWLALRSPAPDEILPGWMVARLFGGRLTVVPDLLALWKSTDIAPTAVLAVEVDLATEPLASILVPKLRGLVTTLGAWMPTAIVKVFVLVPTARRQQSLQAMLGELDQVVVEVGRAVGVNSHVKST